MSKSEILQPIQFVERLKVVNPNAPIFIEPASLVEKRAIVRQEGGVLNSDQMLPGLSLEPEKTFTRIKDYLKKKVPPPARAPYRLAMIFPIEYYRGKYPARERVANEGIQDNSWGADAKLLDLTLYKKMKEDFADKKAADDKIIDVAALREGIENVKMSFVLDIYSEKFDKTSTTREERARFVAGVNMNGQIRGAV